MKSMFSSIPKLTFLGKSAKDGTPRIAIITQSILSLILMYTMNFESLIYYVAFTLSLFTLLTVFGLFVLRYKQGKPNGYKAWGYPFTPIVFLVTRLAPALGLSLQRPLVHLGLYRLQNVHRSLPWRRNPWDCRRWTATRPNRSQLVCDRGSANSDCSGKSYCNTKGWKRDRLDLSFHLS